MKIQILPRLKDETFSGDGADVVKGIGQQDIIAAYCCTVREVEEKCPKAFGDAGIPHRGNACARGSREQPPC